MEKSMKNYIYMYIYIEMCLYTHVYIYTYTYMYTYIHVCVSHFAAQQKLTRHCKYYTSIKKSHYTQPHRWGFLAKWLHFSL